MARKLLNQGHTVGILVRRHSPEDVRLWQARAARIQGLADSGAHVLTGDVSDIDSLARACYGVRTVITTATGALRSTATGTLRGAADSLQSVDLQGTRNLIDAARGVGVKHFIYTSMAASRGDGHLPLFQVKARVEAYLRASGLAYTILRPGLFMDIWINAVVGAPLRAGQPVTLVGQGKTQIAFAALQDIVAYALAAVQNPAALNQTLSVAAPQSYTWNQVVDQIAQTLDMNLLVTYARPDETLPVYSPVVAQVMRALELGGDQFVPMQRPAELFGIPPTTLQTFVEQAFQRPAPEPIEYASQYTTTLKP